MLSRRRPACPTKGSPFASSSAPGASPTNSQSARWSPTPGTALFRVRARPHAVHAETSAAKCAQSSIAIRVALCCRSPCGASLTLCGDSLTASACDASFTAWGGSVTACGAIGRPSLRYRARNRQPGASPSSCKMSIRSATAIAAYLARGARARATAQHQRVLACAGTVGGGIVACPARDGDKSFRTVKSDRRRVREAHLQKALFGAEAQSVVEESAQQGAGQTAPSRLRRDGEGENLRFG